MNEQIWSDHKAEFSGSEHWQIVVHGHQHESPAGMELGGLGRSWGHIDFKGNRKQIIKNSEHMWWFECISNPKGFIEPKL